MTNHALWLCFFARMREKIADYGHAMPIGLGKACISSGIGLCDTPVLVFARGRSVPISRGSPPTSQ
jgi:hypothetical protein